MAGEGQQNAIGRSRGGVNTKIHAATDTRGRPLSITILRGPVSNVHVGPFLMRRLPARHCIADGAYDSNAFRIWLKARGTPPVIPSSPNREWPLPIH